MRRSNEERIVPGLPYARRMVQIFRMHDTGKWDSSIDVVGNCTAVRITSFFIRKLLFCLSFDFPSFSRNSVWGFHKCFLTFTEKNWPKRPKFFNVIMTKYRCLGNKNI